jgi:DNA repair photolyase
MHGRGASGNPANRFEEIHIAPDPDLDPAEAPLARTQFLHDDSRSVISYNDSPDIPFRASINPYRGCEHGCAYCYARPYHEYLGMSAGLDFESRILVKRNAAELLRTELSARGWEPQTIAISGVTDCYQPCEREFRLTRACLEVLLEFRNPVTLITKNALVTRDIDLLAELARLELVSVALSITTLNEGLRAKLEPRTSTAAKRLEAVRKLSDAGVPVGVMAAPIMPGLNDHEVPELVARAAASGARFVGYTLLRLPHGVKQIFDEWLREHEPLKRDRVLNRVAATRGGRMNDPRFGARMAGEGAFAEQVSRLFEIARGKAGLGSARPVLAVTRFRVPGATKNLFA